MENIIEIQHLTKDYGRFKLDDISFSLPKGSIMGLIGENGAGKSTTIKSMLGIVRPDSGRVTFWGKPLENNKQLKEDIGVVFDEPSFYEGMTPKEIGNIHAAAYTQWDDRLYNDYLHRFNLPADQKMKGFSKGMRTKLCIAAALSHKPKLLILDEPTAGLDPVMREDILEVFLDFVQDEEHSILISSHISTDLEKIADYITFIHKGKLQLTTTKDDLRYNYGVIRCGEEQLRRLDKKDILTYRKEPYQYSVLVADKAAAARKYPDVVMDNASIDDILLLYVKGVQA